MEVKDNKLYQKRAYAKMKLKKILRTEILTALADLKNDFIELKNLYKND